MSTADDVCTSEVFVVEQVFNGVFDMGDDVVESESGVMQSSLFRGDKSTVEA